MKKTKVGISGCLGRMGQELVKQTKLLKSVEFVGGFDLKNNLATAAIYGPISIITPPLSFFDERMLLSSGFGIEKFTFIFKIFFFWISLKANFI